MPRVRIYAPVFLDANIWIGVIVPHRPRHATASALLARLYRDDHELVACNQVYRELHSTLVNEWLQQPIVPIDVWGKAARQIASMLRSTRIRTARESQKTLRDAMNFQKVLKRAGKAIHDCHLWAVAAHGGARTFVSADRDYRQIAAKDSDVLNSSMNLLQLRDVAPNPR